MAKRRNLSLSKYGISDTRYLELYHFCKGYDERNRKIAALRSPSPPVSDGMPRGGGVGNPTERNGIEAVMLAEENRMIEEAAEEADAELAPWLLKGARWGLSYKQLRLQYNIPCCENEHRKCRHKFFYILDRKKRGL